LLKKRRANSQSGQGILLLHACKRSSTRERERDDGACVCVLRGRRRGRRCTALEEVIVPLCQPLVGGDPNVTHQAGSSSPSFDSYACRCSSIMHKAQPASLSSLARSLRHDLLCEQCRPASLHFSCRPLFGQTFYGAPNSTAHHRPPSVRRPTPFFQFLWTPSIVASRAHTTAATRSLLVSFLLYYSLTSMPPLPL
jgi:hypothetical protein